MFEYVLMVSVILSKPNLTEQECRQSIPTVVSLLQNTKNQMDPDINVGYSISCIKNINSYDISLMANLTKYNFNEQSCTDYIATILGYMSQSKKQMDKDIKLSYDMKCRRK